MSDNKQKSAAPPHDAFSHYARLMIEKSVQNAPPIKHSGIGTRTHVPISESLSRPPIGIIGAGPGGLYAAMMLESLGIEFEILEASDHTGGRLFTHFFNEKEPYDYYDVGAMRFPQTNLMTRLFHLFKLPQLNSGNIQLNSKVKDFIFKTDYCFYMYNGIRHRIGKTPPAPNDPFNFGIKPEADSGDVEPDFIAVGSKSLVDDAVVPFYSALEADLTTNPPGEAGWRKLMRFDEYSTRGFMSDCLKYPTATIDWLETMDKSTGWYDRSLAETVLESLAFGEHNNPTTKWSRLDGGAQVLTTSMQQYIETKAPEAIKFKQFVNSIHAVRGPEGKTETIRLTVLGEEEPLEYQHVISTAPLTCLRTMDLDDAGLSWKQTNALRQLQYGPSIKVGIKFKSDWWSHWKTRSGEDLNIVGGQSYTDRSIRTVVYPSYGPTSVLIASYCWTDDAARLGALINPPPGMAEQANLRLKELVLKDLAILHDIEYGDLVKEFDDIYAWDWVHNPLSQGAFAFFGPGEFSCLYKSLTQPAADGRLHFAGEALSVRHAWVVGALDSAWRAVKEVLWLSYHDKIPLFEELWGKNPDWTITTPRLNVPNEDLLINHLSVHSPGLFENK